MAKFRKVDDVYGRFLDYDDMTDVPIAMLDENGNTIVMTQSEYEEMLKEQEEAQDGETAAGGQ